MPANEMLDRFLVNEEELAREVAAAFGGSLEPQHVSQTLDKTVGDFKSKAILTGRITGRSGNEVVVDVGLKSEGYIPVDEWDDPASIKVGEEIAVLIEALESDGGTIVLSKRKADRIRGWEMVMAECQEGKKISGKVTRKIKGGLLVDIGVPVFLPASQVDIRRPADINEYIGRTIEAVVIKIDHERRNIVVSRRKLLEDTRAEAKNKLMAEIEIGQIREGVVKNIADFGAFVDLGGIDGLLHITDMSWDRIGHPSEVVKVDERVQIKILAIDKEKEKIALGLKQTQPNPWDGVEAKYPVNSRIKGEIVSLTNYGAFVKLEPGIEGLIHISEMSWTRRINHPSELLNAGDTVECVVLDVNRTKQEISLGLKQTETNPWTRVAEKYPPNTIVTGKVRNLTNYGAFIEIEEGIDGLLHISDMSWTKKIGHPSELLKKGDDIKCVVLSVDQEKQRIALGLKQLTEDPWLRAVPERYIPGMIVQGKVTKITNFGVFVELEQDLEGLLHVSELADHKVDDPHNEVQIGQDLEVKILRVDTGERKIALSKKRADWAAAATSETDAAAKPGKAPKQRRGGLHGAGDQSTQIISHDVIFKKDEAADSTEGQSESDSNEESAG
jgi:small subunit ribosomal protein S1